MSDAPCPDSDTLIRLAKSCERAANSSPPVGTPMRDLDPEDFRVIARVLHQLAERDR